MKRKPYFYIEIFIKWKGDEVSLDTFCFETKKERRQCRDDLEMMLANYQTAHGVEKESDMPEVNFHYFWSRERQLDESDSKKIFGQIVEKMLSMIFDLNLKSES